MRALNVVSIASQEVNITVTLNTNVATAEAQTYEFPTSAYTNNIVVSADGGKLPYTYQWNFIEGNFNGISSLTANNVVFTLTTNESGVYTALWNCTVTDDNGSQATSENVNVTITFNP